MIASLEIRLLDGRLFRGVVDQHLELLNAAQTHKELGIIFEPRVAIGIESYLLDLMAKEVLSGQVIDLMHELSTLRVDTNRVCDKLGVQSTDQIVRGDQTHSPLA
jgi:hypothetical protein